MEPQHEGHGTAESPAPADFQMVERPADLAPLLEAIETVPEVALDTEADSLHHYREKVCLIQLTTGDRHWIVDPLAEGLELEPLMRLLERRPLVLHGADYDLRLLGRTWNFRPVRLFDTMLAAQLLGFEEIGLAALVERLCGVTLNKQGQRADWSVRPLSPKLLAYAVDDTRYLYRVSGELRGQLEARGRLAWLEESVERLIETTGQDQESTSARNGDDAWRIKGGRHLRGRAAAMLRELWLWREEIASRIDRPPFRVAPNSLLLEWAGWAAKVDGDEGDGERPASPAWLRGGRLQSFEAAIDRVLAMPPRDWPQAAERQTRGRRFQPEEEDLLKKLMTARDGVARSLGLHPGVLGPREALKGLVRPRPKDVDGLRQHGGLMRWQAENLAPALLPLLAERGDGRTVS